MQKQFDPRGFFGTTFKAEFRSAPEHLAGEQDERLEQAKNILPFGISFLDDATGGGLLENDLCVITGRTGGGKTQIATMVAMHHAARGKRVHFFALESEPREIERRMKFKLLSGEFFKRGMQHRTRAILNYKEWRRGKLNDVFQEIEHEINDHMSAVYQSLNTYYGGGDFTVDTLHKELVSIEDKTDLVVIDHLHHFDFEDENENRGLKRAVKKIRHLALDLGKPVILLAQIRKGDRKSKTIVPGEEDLHGSSDIAKIATKVITMAPDYDTKTGNKYNFPTYMRLAKDREDNSRARYAALTAFNTEIGGYSPYYQLGKLNVAEDEFQPINTREALPYWASGASTGTEKLTRPIWERA